MKGKVQKLNKLIIIAGPTASGKSSVSVELAKILDTQIVSADSMQIYKGFDVGTAKITESEMQGIKHYMIDIVTPDESYSVNEYINDAKKIIAELHNDGKIPIIAGGTGLYINSLIYNFDLTEHNSDPRLRRELENLYMEKGGEYLIEILREFDPESAERIHPNNYRRVIRAIEIYKVSGTTMTEQIEKTKKTKGEYEVSFFVLHTDRKKLYDRINRRVDKMIEQGLEEEVRNLWETDIPKNATSMQAIGYKEFTGVINGEMTVSEAVDKIKQESRKYAKRQLTWFRRNEGAMWIDTEDFGDDPKKIAEHIYGLLKEKGTV